MPGWLEVRDSTCFCPLVPANVFLGSKGAEHAAQCGLYRGGGLVADPHFLDGAGNMKMNGSLLETQDNCDVIGCFAFGGPLEYFDFSLRQGAAAWLLR